MGFINVFYEKLRSACGGGHVVLPTPLAPSRAANPTPTIHETRHAAAPTTYNTFHIDASRGSTDENAQEATLPRLPFARRHAQIIYDIVICLFVLVSVVLHVYACAIKLDHPAASEWLHNAGATVLWSGAIARIFIECSAMPKKLRRSLRSFHLVFVPLASSFVILGWCLSLLSHFGKLGEDYGTVGYILLSLTDALIYLILGREWYSSNNEAPEGTLARDEAGDVLENGLYEHRHAYRNGRWTTVRRKPSQATLTDDEASEDTETRIYETRNARRIVRSPTLRRKPSEAMLTDCEASEDIDRDAHRNVRSPTLRRDRGRSRIPRSASSSTATPAAAHRERGPTRFSGLSPIAKPAAVHCEPGPSRSPLRSTMATQLRHE